MGAYATGAQALRLAGGPRERAVVVHGLGRRVGHAAGRRAAPREPHLVVRAAHPRHGDRRDRPDDDPRDPGGRGVARARGDRRRSGPGGDYLTSEHTRRAHARAVAAEVPRSPALRASGRRTRTSRTARRSSGPARCSATTGRSRSIPRSTASSRGSSRPTPAARARRPSASAEARPAPVHRHRRHVARTPGGTTRHATPLRDPRPRAHRPDRRRGARPPPVAGHQGGGAGGDPGPRRRRGHGGRRARLDPGGDGPPGARDRSPLVRPVRPRRRRRPSATGRASSTSIPARPAWRCSTRRRSTRASRRPRTSCASRASPTRCPRTTRSPRRSSPTTSRPRSAISTGCSSCSCNSSKPVVTGAFTPRGSAVMIELLALDAGGARRPPGAAARRVRRVPVAAVDLVRVRVPERDGPGPRRRARRARLDAAGGRRRRP